MAKNTSSAKKIESSKINNLNKILEDAVLESVFPGAVLLVGREGKILHQQACGQRTLSSKDHHKDQKDEDSFQMKIDTVFDLAGITMPMVTTTLVMKLVEAGKLKLSDKVIRIVQSFAVHNKSAITIASLLNHTSGLTAWYPFFEELIELNSSSRVGIITSRGAKEYVYNLIHRMELDYQTGTKQVFSDLGFILLGEIVELLTGLTLERAAYRYIFQPLGLKSTSFIDLSMIKRRGILPVTDLIAPTENCSWRKRILCGEVHDDNAWAMGGIAGHAGLFSTANDLHLWASEMMAAYRGRSDFLESSTVKLFWTRNENQTQADWCYGWDTPNQENDLKGSKLSPTSVGICGFTGCMLWLEPDRNLDIILMSNRIHPSRNNKKIKAFRSKLIDAVLDAY